MDRLTGRSEVSRIVLVHGHGLGPAYFDSKRDYKIYCEAIDRLAAYEDTGLEPDEVDQIHRASQTMMFPTVGDFVRYSIFDLFFKL